MQISGRNVSDFRLLLAAIHTDVQPLSNVRGKCYVRHKDRIEDVIKWKKLPDHFYFVKYFDPYIKREFEVLRTEAVNNSQYMPPCNACIRAHAGQYRRISRMYYFRDTNTCSPRGKWWPT